MEFIINLEEHNNLEVKIKRSTLTGRTKVFVEGNEVVKGKKGKAYEIALNDGSTISMQIKGSGFDYVPKVYIDEKEIFLADKLKGYEYAMAFFPLVLVILGGALGGIFGGLASVHCLKIVRSEMNIALKLLSILGISILAGIMYLIFASIFLVLIG